MSPEDTPAYVAFDDDGVCCAAAVVAADVDAAENAKFVLKQVNSGLRVELRTVGFARENLFGLPCIEARPGKESQL